MWRVAMNEQRGKERWMEGFGGRKVEREVMEVCDDLKKNEGIMISLVVVCR